ncbi:MAG: hypothetical protein FJZ58_03310 [Chlamydiae bacterium]|nr:hypothetical protein [Chlamydiota bacterium]
MKKTLRLLLFLGFSLTPLQADLSYKVEYVGVEDATAMKTIKSLSLLTTLKKNPPDSIHALRYRAEADIPEILKILHSRGYYEATVDINVREESTHALVLVKVQLGPPYVLSSFTYSLFQGSKDHCITCSSLDSTLLHSQEHKQINAADVINAELNLLRQLAQCGYPMALIADRSMVADGDTKTVTVHLDLNAGPLCTFGPVTIQGNIHVKLPFFTERILWKEGEIYDEKEVEDTQKLLMNTGLFSSVAITHPLPPNEQGVLPIYIDVVEGKHKSIYGGVSYQTYYGPGVTFGWENKNVAGLGRNLNLQGDITKRSHTGLASYTIPNFLVLKQDYVVEARAVHLHILPYLERSYHLSQRLEKRLWEKMRFSFGIEGERLFVNASVQNGNYWMIEAPLFLGIDRSNDLLNPTKGYTFEYSLIPSFLVSPGQHSFLVQKITASHYLPMDTKHIVVIAQKWSLGSILSSNSDHVPVPKRFFGGSEEDMRGYAYYSVSPLEDNKPTGGQSAFFYTLETRLRISPSLGFVPFFDMGCVANTRWIPLQEPWFKSLGLGVRYFSFMGPFRLDVGFPLHPRKGLDKRCKILISVGQSF